eukprot:TRINITY_DN1441_c0_g2_i1.p3 TRINITY_DN1441_c0_g2~~TRINITY_DN1441_c0_g2_i1.p3  ORF type:complete len:152 (-),score=35.26 TRINITY_DN1441_c0_g2_i1:45-500(-)
MDAVMDLKDVGGEALELGMAGYSCSQAVACAFGRRLQLDEKLLFRMVSPLAGGMLTGNVCGVVGAGLLVIGVIVGPESADDGHKKQLTIRLGTEFMDSFAAAHGSILCAELWAGADIHSPGEARISGLPERLIRSGAVLLAEILEREGLGH